MEIKLQLTGIKPLLSHNGRLANPLDPWSRKLSTLTGKRRKTDEDYIALMMLEARASCYETPDGMLAFPTANVWRCIYDAAKAYKRGEDIKRALSFDDVNVPIYIKERSVTCDDFLADPANIDYRNVKVNGRKIMRARPMITNWASIHTFDVLTDVIDPNDLVPIIQRAGRLVGIGDWRPIYGTFDAAVV